MDFNTHNATPESAVDTQIQRAKLDIHTALPVKVVSFNPTNQTITAEAQVKQILVGGELAQIPPLVDVPVSFPRGGGFAVTFPLRTGDEGFVVFSERCFDGWWQSGKSSEPLDFRQHDLSDAMFVPGICSVPNAISDFFTGGLSLQTLDGSTFIRVENNKITIQGDIEHQGNTNQTGSTTTSETITAKNVIGTEDVTAGGISGKNHTHSGVESGDKNTGAPQ